MRCIEMTTTSDEQLAMAWLTLTWDVLKLGHTDCVAYFVYD